MTDARMFLKSIGEADARIQLKIRQMQDLRNQLLILTRPMDQEQVTHTKNVGVMADTVAMIVDIQEEIDHQARDFLEKKRDAIRMMGMIPPESADILAARYFDRKTFDEIGKMMYITKRHVIRKHNEALAEFQAVLEQNESKNN